MKFDIFKNVIRFYKELDPQDHDFFGQMIGRRPLYIKVLGLIFPTIPTFFKGQKEETQDFYIEISCPTSDQKKVFVILRLRT